MTIKRRDWCVLVAGATFTRVGWSQGLDHRHAAWSQLLSQHVVLLRKRGVYDEPRIHFAVNCAAIGCPMLREEAYVSDRLERQLDQQTRRFVSDRTRNRWNEPLGRLELSPSSIGMPKISGWGTKALIRCSG